MLIPPIFKNYEILRNVTVKNTKVTAKSVHIVTCGSFILYKMSICEIHMFMVCTYFVQCIKIVQSQKYFRILFHVNRTNAQFNELLS